MRWTRSVLTLTVLGVVGVTLGAAQDIPTKNPFEGNADAVRAGMGVFRARCAECH